MVLQSGSSCFNCLRKYYDIIYGFRDEKVGANVNIVMVLNTTPNDGNISCSDHLLTTALQGRNTILGRDGVRNETKIF